LNGISEVTKKEELSEKNILALHSPTF